MDTVLMETILGWQQGMDEIYDEGYVAKRMELGAVMQQHQKM